MQKPYDGVRFCLGIRLCGECLYFVQHSARCVVVRVRRILPVVVGQIMLPTTSRGCGFETTVALMPVAFMSRAVRLPSISCSLARRSREYSPERERAAVRC